MCKNFHHRLTKRELQQIFDVSHQNDVPEYELINVKKKQFRDGTMHLLFDAWEQKFHVDLKPNLKLLSPHLISVVRDGKRSLENRGLPPNLKTDCHFHGKVLSHDNVSAAISYCSYLTGTIILDDHFLLLQTVPQSLRNNHQVKQQHVIYKRQVNPLTNLDYKFEEPVSKLNEQPVEDEFCDVSKSVDDTAGMFNKATAIAATVASAASGPLISFMPVAWNWNFDETEGPTFNYSIPAEGNLDSLFIFPQLDPVTLEIGLFLDSKLYEHFQREHPGDAEQHLVDFSLALINNVHILYQQSSMTPNLDIVIVRFELWKRQPIGLETLAHRNGQAQTLLNLFCRHQANLNPGTDLTDPEHWDHGILLTGYDIYHTTTSVAGVAPVARMCDQIFACSLVEGMHLGRSFVLAHEMGHNMGMVHDGVQNQCGRSCCLMSAVNGAGKTTWSKCSVREFNAFLLDLDESGRGNCLRDVSEGLLTYNHMKNGSLPGQRLTADQQCSYFWGRGFEVEIPEERMMDDICRILWCGNNGSTISTAHPALEGSWCGNNKVFCIEGRCQPWPYGMVPAKVDGAWSEWNSKEERCPISQCQITGSIQIKSQMRTCTKPAPNNGGKKCSGSGLRGLVCGNVKSTCKAMTMLEYGTKLCAAIKYDQEKPDRQLTGAAFLHGTQPCKIWCHLVDSELIRNKGHYPDGSPCGPGKFCVGGKCLMLMCDNKAVVESVEDCPAAAESYNGEKWSEWSEWSECSVSCGKDGKQQRKRICQKQECSGESTNFRPCIPETAPCWEAVMWNEWSECNVTCGDGYQTRTQICVKGQNCSNVLREERYCNQGKCSAWYEWELWSPCSSTCGNGQRSRKRQCRELDGCEGEGAQIEPCQDKTCVLETWGDWLPCSVSCGLGFQLRERLCNGSLCGSSQKQARTCNEKNCDENVTLLQLWSEWTDWLPCSASCGEGVQLRVRKCITDDCPKSNLAVDQRRCVLRPCPEWSSWSDWTACLTCEHEEVRRRKRYCRIGLIRAGDEDHECSGEANETEACDISCKASIPTKDKKLRRKVPSNYIAAVVTPEVKLWDMWQEWQPCSRSCGTGTRIRKRTCRKGANCTRGEPLFDIQSCNDNSCSSADKSGWSSWSHWSSCSTTCGEGLQARFRKCTASLVFLCNGRSMEERSCNSASCADDLNSIISASSTSDANLPRWSEWSEWSSCSCFTMNQFRRRFCQIIELSLQGFCVGAIFEKRPCTPHICLSKSGDWSSWSEWSSCSSSCGTSGHQIRNRMCSNPLPSNRGSYCSGFSFDQRLCVPEIACTGTPIDGAWTTWSEWSQCSDPCINGYQSRTRFCSNPRALNGGSPCLGSDFELAPCNDTSRCLQCRGLQHKMERGVRGLRGQPAPLHVALRISHGKDTVKDHPLKVLASHALDLPIWLPCAKPNLAKIQRTEFGQNGANGRHVLLVALKLLEQGFLCEVFQLNHYRR
uniref:Peptidase M12B domain-containing protein n=1 Tax=Setaria digitata TaxID=48799 RepID=A0A915PU21_9BILA